MCTNYAPVQRQILRDIFGVEPPPAEWKPEGWPDYAEPIVRMDGDGRRESVLASFGLVPRSRVPHGVRPYDTMNARSETVGEKRPFSGPWKKGQLCLIPDTAVYEPNYVARAQVDAVQDLAVWRGRLWYSRPLARLARRSLLVHHADVNAGKHPVMNRMHAPGKEKRSVVIVPRHQWNDWLACRDPEVAQTFMTLFPAEAMATEPAPIVRRPQELQPAPAQGDQLPL